MPKLNLGIDRALCENQSDFLMHCERLLSQQFSPKNTAYSNSRYGLAVVVGLRKIWALAGKSFASKCHPFPFIRLAAKIIKIQPQKKHG